MADW
jgi:hypothetical protein